MKALLGIRDSLALFYSMHDTVLNLFLKFSALTALCCLILTGSCGGTIADPVRYLPALAAGAAGCLLPGASAILPLCVWIVFCAWLCSLEAALAAAVLELLFLLLFFSFFPDDAWVVITVMLLCLLKIPSAAVLAGALLLELNAVPGIAAGCFLAAFPAALGIPRLAEAGMEAVFTVGTRTPEHVLRLMEGVLSSEAWVLTAIVLTAGFLIVYVLRIIPASYMAPVSVLAGLTALIMLYGIKGLVYPGGFDMPGMAADLAVGLLLAGFVLVFRFSLDYRRTESLRFEDDDYMYYVRAVPKMSRGRTRNKKEGGSRYE